MANEIGCVAVLTPQGPPGALPDGATFWRGGLTRLRDALRAGDDRAAARREAAFAFGVRVASAAILYCSQILLARLMGGHDYGIYVFVWTLVLLLGGLSHLGMNVAVMRLLPRYLALGQPGLARGLMRGGRLLVIANATGIALLAGAVLWAFPGLVANYYLLPAFLGLACIPMAALTDLQDGIGRSQGWVGTGLLPPYVLRPTLVLVAMLAAHWAGLPMAATTAVGAAIFATWLTALVQTLLINRRLGTALPPAERAYDVRGWLAFSLPLAIISCCELTFQNADLIIVSQILTPHEAGIYYASAKTMALIMFVHYAVGSAIANRFAAVDARDDRAALEVLVRDGVVWTFWPSLAAGIAVLALGKPLLSLFGPGFEAGYPVMAVIVIGFLFRSAMGPVELLLNMLGQHRICAMVLVGCAVLDIALNLIMVPQFGMIGAAAASSIAFSAAALANYAVARRRLRLNSAIWHHWKPRAAMAA
jgi:O-antigen/teichoic acid export membrane protein